jgi:F-type H+-transporting ATPase subunit delta
MKSSLKVTITSAIDLTSAQVKKITDAVEKKHTKSSVEFKQVVDPAVIAGLKVTIGSNEIDATAYSKLESLHLQIKQSL